MDEHRNIAARAGRWSARHRKKAVFGWLAFVIIAFQLGNMVGTQTLDVEESGVGDSGRADKIVADAFPKKSEEQVLVQSDRLRADDPRFRAGVADVIARLEKTKYVRKVESPYAGGSEGSISPDGRSALVTFEIPGDSEQGDERVAGALAATAAAQRAHPNLHIGEFGDASASKALNENFEDDLQKAEVTSLPITLVILVIAFGALVAAGLPLLLAMTGVLGTFGLVGLLSQIWPVDSAIQNVILLIGLAVGVDYSLFYLRREREERAAGRSEEASLQAAAATSGRAVLISGCTVMIAMAGMYLAGAATFTSFATGTILVVAVSVIGSLTVLPALLSKLGDRVDKGHVPFVRRLKGRSTEVGLWSRIVDRVLRRPVVSVVLAGGLLVALALPTLGLHTALPGVETYPRSLEVMRTYDRIQAAFPTESIPVTAVVKADNVTDPDVASAIAWLETKARQRKDVFKGPATVDLSPDLTVSTISFPAAGDGTNEASNRALDVMREDLVPSTLGKVDGVEANVTGMAAATRDFNDTMSSHIPYVFAFVLSAAFLLLLVTFRSIVIAIKAILLNLLSVAAAYGVLVLVFQEGWGEGLLGFESNGAITAWLPLFLFVILFGLSMDYHVFILTRVREAFDQGMSTENAVAHAIKSTAGTVTSAAAVMVAVFAVFATLTSLDLKQMGIGLAAAVLIDATVIRAVLLPATMKLLGDWNWWLPKRLEWLPAVSHEAAVGAGAETAPAQPAPGAASPATAPPKPAPAPSPGTAVALSGATLGIDVEQRGPQVRVQLTGELDLASGERLRKRLEQVEAERPRVLLIDLRRLGFMDSTGLGEMVAAVQRGKAAGRRVVLVKAPGPIDNLLAMTRVDVMMETVEDPAAVGFEERGGDA
jgi:anti-anti-sigma factor